MCFCWLFKIELRLYMQAIISNNMELHALYQRAFVDFLYIPVYPYTIPLSTSGVTTSKKFRSWFNYPNHTLRKDTKLLIMKFSTNNPSLCKAQATWTGPEDEPPRFQANRHMKVARLQLYAPAAFIPRKYSWYSFLLDAESTQGPEWSRKDCINEKLQWHHREGNQQPPGL